MLNQAHITWKECAETADSLWKVVDLCRESDSLYIEQLIGKNRIITLQSQQIQGRDALISVQQSSLGHKDKQIKKLKIGNTVWKVGAGAGVVAIILLVILL